MLRRMEPVNMNARTVYIAPLSSGFPYGGLSLDPQFVTDQGAWAFGGNGNERGLLISFRIGTCQETNARGMDEF